ncbi:uncharacterized protein LOC130722583 [Lotus japonicus]|uniref:uncharacterized protein LOC130722583 n=1 Tax=Lotus japonicus TaxID=34305 RepID=UPI002585C675|nr:uncharacterized protein LOC130722583 [Lotus japonicus]
MQHSIFSIPIDRFDYLACDSNSKTFEFEILDLNDNIEIKRCGVIPVYASQDQQQTIPTDQCGCKRKTPSFNKDESSRPEKHVVRFDIDLNQTFEVSEVSGREMQFEHIISEFGEQEKMNWLRL